MTVGVKIRRVAVTACGVLALQAGGAVLAPRAEAVVFINFVQSGADVVATGGGTLNTSTFSPGSTADLAQITPQIGKISLGFPGLNIENVNTPISGPLTFGSGGLAQPTSGSGSVFGIDMGAGGIASQLFTPSGYVSGAPLSATDTWSGQTFSSLGLTPGTYVYTWSTAVVCGAQIDSSTSRACASAAALTDSLTINIAAVPEPSSMALMAMPLGMMLFRRRTRRKSFG